MVVGCNIKVKSIMKRYLYILFAAAMALTSCDTEISINKEHVVFFYDDVYVESTENSASVMTIKPYILSGTTKENVVIYLEYWTEGEETAKQNIEEYTENNGLVTFTINGLTPATTYSAQIAMGCDEHDDTEYGEIFSFTTKEHIPVANYACDCEVDAKGVLANVTLQNVSFTIDGKESNLAKVEFKYSLSLSGGKWTSVELTADDIANGFRIPAEGEIYLKENSDYKYVVTLTPEDSNFEEYTVNGKFTTIEAVLSSDNLDTPTITETNNGITLSCAKPTLLIDGVEIADYAKVKYLFYYTDGNNHHGEIEAECADGNMSATLSFSQFKEGATYSFCSRMDINDTKVMDSDEVQYTMPVKETPAPPTPPVSGDADTTALAGEWHLTEWRGTVPSFDVYLSITEDGVVSLFQRMESRLWETFYSLVEIENGIISGVYTDNVAWAHSYYVAIEGNTMTWTSTTDATEVSVYTRCTLPDISNPDIRTYATMETRWF